MAEPFLGTTNLRLGSVDSGPGGRVAELQAELRRMRVLQASEPVVAGHFDSATEQAVRRLQWFAGQVPGALSAAGTYVPRPITHLTIDGVVGPQAKQFLQLFKNQGWSATGLLVQFSFNDLSHTSPNGTYSGLLANDSDIGVCAREFAAVIGKLNAAAKSFGVFIFVNQLFRVEGNAVTGAVVPPAGFSAHKIGRAVDIQLGTALTIQPGVNPQMSMAIKTAAAGTPFAKFREHAKTVLNCRYGGDFSPVDPPHFDQQILPGGGPVWKYHHFFNQLQYRQAVANSAAIPSAGSLDA